jgi:hypothetical protein
LVEDCAVYVTKNLYDAMMVLGQSHEPIVIWIDSLCINQIDNEEKSWQVALMADIYQQAHKVTAWLGQADDSSDAVVDYLNMFGADAEACGLDNGPEPYQKVWQLLTPNAQGDGVSTRITHMRMALFHKIIPLPYRKVCDLFYAISGWHDKRKLLPLIGMKRFFTRAWWGRVWVLQEITLAQNAEFLCGTKRITRRRCSAALNAYCALWFVLMGTLAGDPGSVTPYQLEIIRTLFQHRPTIMLSSENIFRTARFPLAALLRATCVGSINLRNHGPHNLESSDPRDKIYALLGLAKDRADLERLGLSPDYTKSCKELYTTTMAILLEQGHISLLSHCQMPKHQSDLPSWVPDWSRSTTDMLQDVEDDHITIYPKFNASGSESYSTKIVVVRTDGKIEGISIACHIYDEIDKVGSFPGRVSSHEVPVWETGSWSVEWLVEILRLSYRNQQHCLDFRHRLCAAARTSVGGVMHQNSRLSRVGIDFFLEAKALLEKGISYIKDHRIKCAVQQLSSNKALECKGNIEDVPHLRLSREIIGKCLGRLPFITTKGNLVLSSEFVRRGDLVTLMRGAQVPFILRRQTDDKYQLISEAYVDGIMDGEAMNGVQCRNIVLV